MYIIETECKHCGAPGDAWEVSKERFDANKSTRVGRGLFNLLDFETDFDGDITAVKLVFGCCGECRGMY